MQDKKLIIIGLLIIALSIVSVLLFKKPSVTMDTTLYEKRESALKASNDSLNKEILTLNSKVVKQEKIVDSIKNVKSNIKYVYIKKYEKIDNASTSAIIDEFTDIFSKELDTR